MHNELQVCIECANCNCSGNESIPLMQILSVHRVLPAGVTGVDILCLTYIDPAAVFLLVQYVVQSRHTFMFH